MHQFFGSWVKDHIFLGNLRRVFWSLSPPFAKAAACLTRPHVLTSSFVHTFYMSLLLNSRTFQTPSISFSLRSCFWGGAGLLKLLGRASTVSITDKLTVPS